MRLATRNLRPYSSRFYLSVHQKLNPHPSSHEPFAYPQSIPNPGEQIIVAMSSGVDSSVAAALLTEKHGARNVRGIYMANWSQSAKCTENEWADVQKVCNQLQIPCERVNFEKEYWTDVFMPMIDMYQRGLTPNPDLGCNKYIKFGKMIEYLSLKFKDQRNKWWLATGHYSRIEVSDAENGKCVLIRAFDANKDQSYYLASISQSVLSNVLMPLGHYTKPQVREMARARSLCTADKPDSTGLCFVSPDHSKFRDFLDDFIAPNPGNIITEDGKVWGKHQGLWYATIGQKLGVCLPQGDPQYQGVWFVSEKRPETNELVIVKGASNPALFKRGLEAIDWEWFGRTPDLSVPLKYLVQARSLGEAATIESCELMENGTFVCILVKPQRAFAPGQNLVMYEGNKVIGSGVLSRTYNR